MRHSFILIIFLFSIPLYSEEPPLTVTSIQFRGLSSVPEEDVRSILPFEPGDSVEEKNVRLAKEMAVSFLRNSGYLEASVKSTIEKRADGVDLIFSVEEGPLYRFGQTRVTGLTTLPRKVADLETTYREGDPYNRQELFRTKSQLYLSGFYKDIRIQASTTTDHTADITLHLEQKKYKWLKGGVGWGSEEKERVTLAISHENAWHAAHKAELRGTISRIWKEYAFDYTIPYFLATHTEQRTNLSWRNENREGYEYERLRGVASLGRDLGLDTKGTLAYNFQRNVMFDLNPEIALTTPERSDGRSVSIAFNRDASNDIFYPYDGTRTNLRLERSGGFFGGTVDFHKISMDWNAYESIWRDLVAAVSVRTGYVEEFSPSPDVPIFDRFFMGGANSVRGYKERDVGPKDLTGAPLGGKRRFGATLELRFPVVWKLTGAVFWDGGQVGSTFEDVDVSQWKSGAGAGIRFKTPVGPIRLDYGYKLNPDPTDEDRWRIHFSLGESF